MDDSKVLRDAWKRYLPNRKWNLFWEGLITSNESKRNHAAMKQRPLPPQVVSPEAAAVFRDMFPEDDEPTVSGGKENTDVISEDEVEALLALDEASPTAQDEPTVVEATSKAAIEDTAPERETVASDVSGSGLDFDQLKLLYTPHGKWAFLRDKPFKDVKEMLYLGAGAMCSASVQSGIVEHDDGTNKRHTYIGRSWDTRVPTRWRGFFAELALYKSSSYLLPLQGKVVPHLMGLYASPGRVTLAFEPPHDVFWIEASPQMPTVLKKLAIDAFEQLHRQGILHGDVALRHILIDADCRVTLIDFQESFADLPNEDIGIKPIPPGEKEMEMRKVKFFLDYDGARDREIRKTSQAKKRRIANSVLAELRQKQELMNLPPTHIEAIPTPEEDIEEAPVFADVLEEEWMRGMDCMPCRIDMPGVSPVTRALAIEKFMLRIRELEAAAMPAHERHDAFSRRWSVDAEVGSTGSPLSPRSIIGFLFGDPAEDDGAEIDNFKPAPMPMVDLDLWRNNAVSAVAPLQTPLPSPQTRKPAGKRRHQEDFEEDEGRTKKVKLENRPADSLGTFLRRNPSVVESQPTTSSSHLAAAPQINEASPPHQSDKRRSSAPSPAEFRLSSKDPESAAPPFQTPESGPSEVLQPKRRRPNDDGAATEASPTKKPRVASRSKSKAEVESTACPKGSAAIPSGLLSENKTEDLYANVEKPAPRRSKRLQRRSI